MLTATENTMPQVPWREWVERVKAGCDLASFPTDTVPALAARPDRGDVIYAAKQRPPDKPLILMGATLEDLLPYTQGDGAAVAQWRRLSEQFWPGALTLVLPASAAVPAAINPANTGTVGIRVPNHPVRHLLAHTGPLATTSANRSGQPPLTEMVAIATAFPGVLTVSAADIAAVAAAAGGQEPAAPSGQPSTVAAWEPGGWRVLRQGSVPLAAISGL